MNTQTTQKNLEIPSSKENISGSENLTISSQVEDILCFSQVQDALNDLAFDQETPETYDMQIVPRNDIEAYFGPERPEFLQSQRKPYYPARLIEVLASLYDEYDTAFMKLVEKNMESPGDYIRELGEMRKNMCVQIDMVGLPQRFLERIEQGKYSDEVLREVLRRRIFEIENSLAAYSLLRNIDSQTKPTDFETGLNTLIESLRFVTRKKVILLTLSEEKYNAVLQFDAGIPPGNEKDELIIRQNTGFDDIYSPQDLQRAYQAGEENLYYVRASLGREHLKNPDGNFENPLLQDTALRNYVKQRSLTFNIDAPNSDFTTLINDTKEYMPDLGMGYIIESIDDIYTGAYRNFLQQKLKQETFQGDIFLPGFLRYLHYVGCSQEDVETGNIEFHIKPLKCAYGAYGHISGDLRDSEKRAKLKKELVKRKKCILQVRMKNSQCEDTVSGQTYIYIDRIFLYRNALNGKIGYMGGFRNHMPVDSQDGKKGIVHGSAQTVYAPIASDFNLSR